jgi:hypothetical protein
VIEDPSGESAGNEPSIDDAQAPAVPPVSDKVQAPAEPPPPASSVYRFLVYGLSLPERTIRGGSAILAGAVRESASLLVPQAFRNSRSYRAFVDQMLDFMIRDVGGVKAPPGDASPGPQVEGYVARKAVSSFVDLAGMATLHVSPLAVLAIISDVAYGSQTYLRELAAELKREGIIDQNSTIDSTAGLLAALSQAAGTSADAFDTPPISVEGLRSTIEQTRSAVSGINPVGVLPLSEIERTWREMTSVATSQNISLFKLSSAMTLFAMNRMSLATRGALSTIRVSGNILDRHVIDHYREGLAEVRTRGVYRVLADSSKPYVDALWHNFSSGRETITEGVVSGRLISRGWSGLCNWLTRRRRSPEGGTGDSGKTAEP